MGRLYKTDTSVMKHKREKFHAGFQLRIFNSWRKQILENCLVIFSKTPRFLTA